MSDEGCQKCHGKGRRAYASTATWRGGMAGSAMTADICDVCWGSGDGSEPFADLRAALARYRAQAATIAELRASVTILLALLKTAARYVPGPAEDEARLDALGIDGRVKR